MKKSLSVASDDCDADNLVSDDVKLVCEYGALEKGDENFNVMIHLNVVIINFVLMKNLSVTMTVLLVTLLVMILH